MRLNLHFIQEDLPELGFEGTIVDPPSVARCRTVRLVDALPPHLDEGVLYIIAAQGLPPSPPKSAKASILCIGKPPKQWVEAPLNMLYTSRNICETDAMNEVVRLFDEYRTWEESLRDLIDQGFPFESLGAEAVAMFGNPIIAQDISYKLLFYSLPESEKEGWSRLHTYREVIYGQHISEGGLAVPRGAAMAFNQNPEFIELERAKDPVLFSGDTWSELSDHTLCFRSLLYNCCAGEDPVARVIVDEVARPLRCKDHILIKILGDCLSRALRSPGAGNAGRGSRFARLCEKLIADGSVADNDLSETMRYLGWHADDEFFCILLREHDTHRSFSAIAQVAISITARNYSRQYHFIDGRALVICNLTTGAQGRSESMEDIIRNLQGLDVAASFSSSFRGFGNLPHYYRQALIVEELGYAEQGFSRHSKFEDHALGYLLSKCAEGSTLDAIIPDGLRRLIALDEKRGTEDAHLLEVFLDNDRNIAKTIRELYIHRNTFLYRLDKIKEALDADLENPDIRLSIQIALRALRYMEEGRLSHGKIHA